MYVKNDKFKNSEMYVCYDILTPSIVVESFFQRMRMVRVFEGLGVLGHFQFYGLFLRLLLRCVTEERFFASDEIVRNKELGKMP